jgi:hypothetical protein
MGRRSGGGRWVSVSLPPAPIRPKTPEERAACAVEFEAFTAAAIARAERYAERKARETPEQREAKAARDYVHWLKRQLRRAVDAARWEHVTAALEAHAWEREDAKRKADELRQRVRDRTAETYKRAANGCQVCAAYLADDSTDVLYAEAFGATTEEH